MVLGVPAAAPRSSTGVKPRLSKFWARRSVPQAKCHPAQSLFSLAQKQHLPFRLAPSALHEAASL
jgi:hypothetical protein